MGNTPWYLVPEEEQLAIAIMMGIIRDGQLTYEERAVVESVKCALCTELLTPCVCGGNVGTSGSHFCHFEPGKDHQPAL